MNNIALSGTTSTLESELKSKVIKNNFIKLTGYDLFIFCFRVIKFVR